MTSRPAPRVPAGSNSLAALVDLYQRQHHLDVDAERIIWALPQEERDQEKVNLQSSAAWSSSSQIAQIMITQPVSSLADILITLGMAANYFNGIVGSLDGEIASMGASIETAITNALDVLVRQGAARELPVCAVEMLKQVCTLPQAEAA